MRTGSATARTTGRRTWLSCAAWLSIWLRWSPQKRRLRLSKSAPDGITPTWSPSSPKPQKVKCDSPALVLDPVEIDLDHARHAEQPLGLGHDLELRVIGPVAGQGVVDGIDVAVLVIDVGTDQAVRQPASRSASCGGCRTGRAPAPPGCCRRTGRSSRQNPAWCRSGPCRSRAAPEASFRSGPRPGPASRPRLSPARSP